MSLTVRYCRSLISKFGVGWEPKRLYRDCGDLYWCIIRKRLDRMRKGKIASVLWCSLWCCKTSQFWIGLNVRVELGLKIISCILNFTQRWAFALSNDRISLAMCLPNISKESSCFWLLLFRNTWALRPLFHLSSIF